MVEIEHAKAICFGVAAIFSQWGGIAIAQVAPEGWDKYMERGGTLMCIAFLCYAVRALREERNEYRKRLDQKHDQELENAKLRVQADIMASESRDKMASAIEKLTEVVHKK